jgi:threonyl-tRNA synthetase
MKYFVLNSDKKSVPVEEYIDSSSNDHEFIRFIRREALGEVLVPQSNDKPVYLAHANALGFSWEPNADVGHAQYNYRANLMRRLVQDYARQLVHELDIPVYEVSGANMFNRSHPVVDAYASLYGDRLYSFKSGKNDLVMSYDASYPQFNIAASEPLRHKQLPFAHFSLSDCYRQEQSGELMLLMRHRRFYMPDVHPYFKDPAQAFEWFPKMQSKILESGDAAGANYHVVIEVPSQDIYDEYQEYIMQIPVQLGKDVLVNILEDGKDRYWVVNVDYKIMDKLGQAREIACIQVDIGNAPRLGIHYIDENGQKQHPVIIHSAIPGGIERYLYVMMDQIEKGLPLWISPCQIRIVPVGGEYNGAAANVAKEIEKLGLRAEVDDRAMSVSARIKQAHHDLAGNIVVIGEKELANDCADMRQLAVSLAKSIEGMPFIRREWPMLVSQQV